MEAEILAGEPLERAKAWARERALDQALLLADLTQLAADSVPAGVLEDEHWLGLACSYTGLPFLAVSLWSEVDEVTSALLSTLAAHEPRLRHEAAYALVPEPIRQQLARVALVEEVIDEVKRVYSPADASPPSQAARQWQTAPLQLEDAPALEALYSIVPAMVWTPQALAHGPARGIWASGRLVCAAGVHLLTPEVAEIGHIATHPAYRRRGMAEAVVRALIDDLQPQTERIFLMQVTANTAAAGLYDRLGFLPYSHLSLTRFRLRARSRGSFKVCRPL